MPRPAASCPDPPPLRSAALPAVLRRQALFALNYEFFPTMTSIGRRPYPFAPTVTAGFLAATRCFLPSSPRPAPMMPGRIEDNWPGGTSNFGVLLQRAGYTVRYSPAPRPEHKIPGRFRTAYFMRLIAGIVRAATDPDLPAGYSPTPGFRWPGSSARFSPVPRFFCGATGDARSVLSASRWASLPTLSPPWRGAQSPAPRNLESPRGREPRPVERYCQLAIIWHIRCYENPRHGG
jgi:hypothetical protein